MRAGGKIKAFTLSEMMVVLLLTSIILGMVFTVLQLVQQHFKSIAGNYESHTEFNLLQQRLWYDFNQSDVVWYDAVRNEMVCSNGLDEVVYEFSGNKLIIARDTFQLEIAKKSIFLMGQEQSEGEIDALEIHLSKAIGSKQLFVYKRNAATTYINQ
ncbi:PulJ/GspJ family protein [Flagellimonas meridianipacifica]|uniref:Pilin/secretion family protein with methylation motif n=1 Tax=Flagellimonas meridianipacifica TaxID=1080225 RepID=A0A2T0MHX5_9FLAO|nr:prepilin-type N-terminal cleavage/methylation domain-containing protein [Allomuricauda pacifica]PRX57188.1 pilin/secretion family protein with methylation motif [Allomuricauda pacifica]